MSNNSSSNRLVVPAAREAMEKFKMEAASEVGVNLKNGYNGDLTSRQAGSVGGTYRDVTDIMIEYGAVNACNLDGGSSSMMWYGDKYINNSASVIGIRPVPTAFVVLKEGVDDQA